MATATELPPGRIRMEITYTRLPTILDMAAFLKNSGMLLQAITKETAPTRKAAGRIRWCIEKIEMTDSVVAFQFMGDTEESFEAIADKITDLWGQLATSALATHVTPGDA